jgi:sigma-B regulation protein RsbU (phosphoserine phosphatase)
MELTSFTPVQNVLHWQTGAARHLLMIVRTRPSLLYSRLFRTLGEWTSAIYIGLTALAIFFALIEVAAFVIGMRLTRTMTLSVDKLYQATEYVNHGDLSEQKEKQRIESELQIAKEVQDLLFPHDSADLDGLELHGICRPARTVSGDYYDFVPLGASTVGLAVADISGKGISAALMMATLHAFVRAHTLAEKLPVGARAGSAVGVAAVSVPGDAGEAVAGGVADNAADDAAGGNPSPGVVLALLNQQLYRSTPEQKYATMFLGFYDQTTRRLTYSNAGHLPPILLRATGMVERLEVGGTVVGLFGDMVYPEGVVELAEGDIVVAFSDGITEPENDYGEFGEDRLVQIVEENRDLPLPRISDAILAAVIDWIGGEEQPDDMTVVLARAR